MINMQQNTKKNPKLNRYVLSERNTEKNKTQKYDILSQIVIDVTTRTRKHTYTDRTNDNGEKVNTHFMDWQRG